MNFRAGSLIKPFDSKRRSRLRQTISLKKPLGCLQSHFLQTSWEIKRLLLSECEAITFLMVAISFLVTDRLRYVMIVSIPDNINHQDPERRLFLKENYDAVLNLSRKPIIARKRARKSFSNVSGCRTGPRGSTLRVSNQTVIQRHCAHAHFLRFPLVSRKYFI